MVRKSKLILLTRRESRVKPLEPLSQYKYIFALLPQTVIFRIAEQPMRFSDVQPYTGEVIEPPNQL